MSEANYTKVFIEVLKDALEEERRPLRRVAIRRWLTLARRRLKALGNQPRKEER